MREDSLSSKLVTIQFFNSKEKQIQLQCLTLRNLLVQNSIHGILIRRRLSEEPWLTFPAGKKTGYLYGSGKRGFYSDQL